MPPYFVICTCLVSSNLTSQGRYWEGKRRRKVLFRGEKKKKELGEKRFGKMATVSNCLLAVLVALTVSQALAETYCTVENDCSGTSHASAVAVVGTSCRCTCKFQWGGSQCQLCPIQYDPATCDRCNAAANYIGTYPDCKSDACTAVDCNFHATIISGVKSTGCKCTCRNQYTGSLCATCPPIFDAADSCGSCAAGYSGYPNCSPTCTIAKNCSGHANNVVGTYATGCTCYCADQWTGPTCKTCPALYDSTTCASCVAGYVNYPNCELGCNLLTDCSDHAREVTGAKATGCNCSCRNQWGGPGCASCPSQYDSSKDCGLCAAGYTGKPPACDRTCVNDKDCNGHASTVTGNTLTGCTCKCRNAWSGTACETCPVGFELSESSDCSKCATGYVGYPTCSRGCSVTEDCSGHAIGVQGDTYSGCSCTCIGKWSGKDCSVCPPQYTGTDCSPVPRRIHWLPGLRSRLYRSRLQQAQQQRTRHCRRAVHLSMPKPLLRPQV